MHPASGRIAFRLALAALSLVLLLPAVASAQGAMRGSSPAARKTQAFEMCREELARRENARDVRGGRVHRNEYDDDKVYVDADFSVRKGERESTRRVECVVDFDGDNRIVRFEVIGGDKASRACREAAEAAGFRVRDAREPRRLEDGARLVELDAGRGNELLCLYGRGVEGIYQRRR